MEEQEIDYTVDDGTQTGSDEIKVLSGEINQLENMLKYPLAFKNAIAGGLLGYFLTKRMAKDNNIAILGSLASSYAAFTFSQNRDLTTEQKHAINEQIIIRKQKLRNLGVEIKADTYSAIGFKVTRELDIPTQTTQPITVTITNGSGGDTQVFNNTYNTVIKAQ